MFANPRFYYYLQIMDNKQGTVIGIGCLALCSLYYFYRQYSKDTAHFKERRRQVHQLKADKQHHSKLDLEQIKRGKKQTVILPSISDYSLQKDTYKLYFRQVRKSQKEPKSLMVDGFAENQSGGRFRITHQNTQITVDIKNCNIDTDLLQGKKEPNIIFEENKSKNYTYESITYSISAIQKLALYGVIKYSISEQKFILEPEFILRALRSEEETIDAIASFWDDKIYNITFNKLVIGFSMLVLGYVFIYRPIKNIWQRYKVRGEGVSEGQFDFFKEKVNFTANIQGGLKCELCKANAISYIYECGHLVACEECHKNNEGHKCPICGKKSRKHMKIFI